jgi:hypothetical protein
MDVNTQETMDGKDDQGKRLPCLLPPRLASSLDQQCIFRCQDLQACVKAAEIAFQAPPIAVETALTALKPRLDHLLLRLQIWKAECVDNNAFLPKINESLDPSLYLSLSTAFKHLRTDLEEIWTNIQKIYSLTEQCDILQWEQQSR